LLRIGLAAELPTIGYLAGPITDAIPVPGLPPGTARARELFEALRGLGYRWLAPGKNVQVVAKSGQTEEELYEAAAALEASGVAAIVLADQTVIESALTATRETPLIVAGCDEPVLMALLEQYSEARANVTGPTVSGAGLALQRLDLLRAILPDASQLAVLYHPNPSTTYGQDQLDRAASLVGMSIRWHIIRGAPHSPADVDRAFERIDGEDWADVVLVLDDPLIEEQHPRITAAANHAARQVPTMGTSRQFVAAGGLLAYGVDRAMVLRRTAAYVEKILRGASPSALPHEHVTWWELAINTATAQLLGGTFPREIEASATIRYPPSGES